jgi:hypothetical protein
MREGIRDDLTGAGEAVVTPLRLLYLLVSFMNAPGRFTALIHPGNASGNHNCALHDSWIDRIQKVQSRGRSVLADAAAQLDFLEMRRMGASQPDRQASR